MEESCRIATIPTICVGAGCHKIHQGRGRPGYYTDGPRRGERHGGMTPMRDAGAAACAACRVQPEDVYTSSTREALPAMARGGMRRTKFGTNFEDGEVAETEEDVFQMIGFDPQKI